MFGCIFPKQYKNGWERAYDELQQCKKIKHERNHEMKWQKNTGVMPCDRHQLVKVAKKSGTFSNGRAEVFDWRIGVDDEITAYTYAEFAPYDYVGQETWTARKTPTSGVRVSRNGEEQFIMYSIGDILLEKILRLLNDTERGN